MENLIEVAMLFDYYGELLSKKQYKMVDDYYNEDLSLTEIAEINCISKQAVSENIKRAIKKMEGFEKKLKLIEKNNKINVFLKEIKKDLENLSTSLLDDEKKVIITISNKMSIFLKENAGDNYL